MFKVPREEEALPELRLERIDGGVCYKYMEMQLRNNQSPYMLNMNADDRGALTKRPGQKVVYTFSEGPIHADILYKNKQIVHHGTKLSSYDEITATELMSGLANAKGTFFVLNDILYYLNGTNFIQYDGTTAKDVEGYIPTIAVATPPSGGGTVLEDLNLIQPGFKQSFSGDGTSVNYQLLLSGLDATTVTATVGGVTKTEGTDFTVDRTTGVVTFSTAPPAGTDNVVITAYKTISGNSEKIKGCKYAVLYGGRNDTRVFIAGNPNYRNYYFYCGVYDASYWPETNYNRLGSDYEAVSGFAVQYDTLITLKERSIWNTTYQESDTGVVSFPTKPINSQMGCDMPWTIKIIDNNPVWCTTYAGPQILLSSQIRDERNVKPLGANINGALNRPGLLDEDKTNLLNATAEDHEGKYYLCVGSKVWVWDYRLTPYQGDDELLAWFPYDNINANCWLVKDGELYYGDRTTGELKKFISNYNDFGQPINAVWRSKLFDFNLPNWLKSIIEIWFDTRAAIYSSINIKYYNDNGEVIDSTTVPAASTGSFSWKVWDWSKFTWKVARFAPTIKKKPKLKKIKYFQIELSNNILNENLSIMSLVIGYSLDKKVK